jgi:hypothetical protein
VRGKEVLSSQISCFKFNHALAVIIFSITSAHFLFIARAVVVMLLYELVGTGDHRHWAPSLFIICSPIIAKRTPCFPPNKQTRYFVGGHRNHFSHPNNKRIYH